MEDCKEQKVADHCMISENQHLIKSVAFMNDSFRRILCQEESCLSKKCSLNTNIPDLFRSGMNCFIEVLRGAHLL